MASTIIKDSFYISQRRDVVHRIDAPLPCYGHPSISHVVNRIRDDGRSTWLPCNAAGEVLHYHLTEASADFARAHGVPVPA